MHILEDGPIDKPVPFILIAMAKLYCFDGNLEVLPIVWIDCIYRICDWYLGWPLHIPPDIAIDSRGSAGKGSLAPGFPCIRSIWSHNLLAKNTSKSNFWKICYYVRGNLILCRTTGISAPTKTIVPLVASQGKTFCNPGTRNTPVQSADTAGRV